ncbi:unnamed protein product [Calypogeia fissa]
MASSIVCATSMVLSSTCSRVSSVQRVSLCCSEFHGSGVYASSSSVVFNRERSLVKGRQAIGSQWRQTRVQGLVVRGLFGLGVPELAVIAGVAAILFGPKKLPEIGKSLGKTVKSFQQAAKEFESEVKAGATEAITETEETETAPTPTSAPPPPAPPTTASTPSDKTSV